MEPQVEILEKEIQTDTQEKKPKFAFITVIGKIGLYVYGTFLGMLAAIILLTSLTLLMKMFANKQFDTTPITSYGFAILAGLTTLTFSWARSVEGTNKKTAHRINVHAENFFMCTLLFLLASLLKYFEKNKLQYIENGDFPDNIEAKLADPLSKILFLFGITLTTINIMVLLIRLIHRDFESTNK